MHDLVCEKRSGCGCRKVDIMKEACVRLEEMSVRVKVAEERVKTMGGELDFERRRSQDLLAILGETMPNGENETTEPMKEEWACAQLERVRKRLGRASPG